MVSADMIVTAPYEEVTSTSKIDSTSSKPGTSGSFIRRELKEFGPRILLRLRNASGSQ